MLPNTDPQRSHVRLAGSGPRHCASCLGRFDKDILSSHKLHMPCRNRRGGRGATPGSPDIHVLDAVSHFANIVRTPHTHILHIHLPSSCPDLRPHDAPHNAPLNCCFWRSLGHISGLIRLRVFDHHPSSLSLLPLKNPHIPAGDLSPVPTHSISLHAVDHFS